MYLMWIKIFFKINNENFLVQKYFYVYQDTWQSIVLTKSPAFRIFLSKEQS